MYISQIDKKNYDNLEADALIEEDMQWKDQLFIYSLFSGCGKS